MRYIYLTPYGVTVVLKETSDGLDVQGYENSASGRVKLLEDIPEPALSEILAVWGKEPTVSPPEPLPEPEPSEPQPDLAEQIAELAAVVDILMEGLS